MRQSSRSRRRVFYPDPVPIGDLVSWERSVDRLKSFSEAKAQAFVSRYLPLDRDNKSRDVGHDEDAPIRLAMLGAVMAGQLSLMVKLRKEHHAYEIAPQVWQNPDGIIAPTTMALTGVYEHCSALPGSLEWHLSGGDLFIRNNEFEKIVAPRPASRDEIECTVRRIIADHKDSHLTRDDFLEQVPADLSFRTTERRLLTIFRKLKPKAWGPGRPPGRPR
jgi:hypothetical protein